MNLAIVAYLIDGPQHGDILAVRDTSDVKVAVANTNFDWVKPDDSFAELEPRLGRYRFQCLIPGRDSSGHRGMFVWAGFD